MKKQKLFELHPYIFFILLQQLTGPQKRKPTKAPFRHRLKMDDRNNKCNKVEYNSQLITSK